jgi:hypothetical protein
MDEGDAGGAPTSSVKGVAKGEVIRLGLRRRKGSLRCQVIKRRRLRFGAWIVGRWTPEIPDQALCAYPSASRSRQQGGAAENDDNEG